MHPLPPGWANVYRDPDGVITVEPCPALLVQSSECRRRLVYATASVSDDGELTAANDRPDYVVTTAYWALALRRKGGGHGRFEIELPDLADRCSEP